MSALKQEVLDEGKHGDHRSDIGGQVEAYIKSVGCIGELQG